jgi:tetratricopeptide (TPR) repeat protein
MAYKADGRIDEAIALERETLELSVSKRGPSDPDTLITRSNLASMYQTAGRTAEAIALDEETLKLAVSRFGPNNPETFPTRNNLAIAYSNTGRTTEAVALHEENLKLCEEKMGPDHPYTLNSLRNLATSYERLGRWTDAEARRRMALARRRKSHRTEKANVALLARELEGLGFNLLKQSMWSEAERALRESLAICEKTQPDDWERFNAMSLLGGSLLGKGKYTEAESLLLQGYEGMSARARKIPAWRRSLVLEAAERVLQLYESWNKPEQAAEWRGKLALADLPADVFAMP